MQDGWAAENLQVIRTLMERSALYRRALAPVSFTAGALGLAAALGGNWAGFNSPQAFCLYWLGLALVTLVASLVIIRRQALRAAEPFWSPPTRRVAEAMCPALCAGLLAGLITLVASSLPDLPPPWWLPAVWLVCYGLALHAAGFFMARGIRWLGWIFIGSGAAVAFFLSTRPDIAHWPPLGRAHAVMGITFGGWHLAYGAYLAFTEPRASGT